MTELNELRELLELLRSELESDVAKAQTRDQHIRLSQRIHSLEQIMHILQDHETVQAGAAAS